MSATPRQEGVYSASKALDLRQRAISNNPGLFSPYYELGDHAREVYFGKSSYHTFSIRSRVPVALPPGSTNIGVHHRGPLFFIAEPTAVSSKATDVGVDREPTLFAARHFNAPVLVSNGKVIVTTSRIATEAAYLDTLQTPGTTNATITAEQILWLNECILQPPPDLETAAAEANAILQAPLVRIGTLRGRGSIAAGTAVCVESVEPASHISINVMPSARIRFGVVPSSAHIELPPGQDVEFLFSDIPARDLPSEVSVIHDALPQLSEPALRQQIGIFFGDPYQRAARLREEAFSPQPAQEIPSQIIERRGRRRTPGRG